MQVAGHYRVVRQRDHVVLARPPKPLSARGGFMDIRAFPWGRGKGPLLLVNAPRKTGSAVARNKFRRRVRMAFLAVLRKRPNITGTSFVLWVRPARGNPAGCRIGYCDIEKQIESSLDRMRHP